MREGWQALVMTVGMIIVMLLAGCAGKVIVIKVPDSAVEKLQLDGVVYALPRTVVKVAIPVERVQFKKGIYAEYAALFLGLA